MGGTSLTPFRGEDLLEREMASLARTLEDTGPLDRRELASRVGARFWGPGRFRSALRAAVAEGRVRRVSRSRYTVADRTG